MTFVWWHVLVAIVPILPSFYSIWHIWTHDFADLREKALWLVLVVFLPVIGWLIYLLVGRRKARNMVQH